MERYRFTGETSLDTSTEMQSVGGYMTIKQPVWHMNFYWNDEESETLSYWGVNDRSGGYNSIGIIRYVSLFWLPSKPMYVQKVQQDVVDIEHG